MAERLSEEEKIRIIQEVIETGNQEVVAKKYGRSKGTVSNLINEFRTGTGVLPGIGIFSNELQDLARLKKNENLSYADLLNLLELGKIAKGLGIDNEILYTVSYHLKEISPAGRDEFFNVFKEIIEIRRPGESIMATEKRLKDDLEKLKDIKGELEGLNNKVNEVQLKKEELEREKNQMEEDIKFTKSINELIGASDRKNVLNIIEALKRADFDADKFIRTSNMIKKLNNKGITIEKYFEINNLLENLIGKGFNIDILNGIENELSKSNKSFTEFLTELKEYLNDKDNYIKNIEAFKLNNENLMRDNKNLNEKNTNLRNEVSNLNSQVQDLNNIIKIKESELNKVLQALGIANDINELEAAKLMYSDLYNSEKKKYEALMQERGELEKALNNLQDEINKAKQQKENLLKDKVAVENALSDLKDLEMKIKEFKEQKASLERDIENIRKEIDMNREKIEIADEFFKIMKSGMYEDQKALRDICQLVINTLPNPIDSISKEIQARAHELLLRITKDACVYDLNTHKVQIITKNEYDDLMNVRTENIKIRSENTTLKNELGKVKGNIIDELTKMAKNGAMNDFWQGLLRECGESALKSILEKEISMNRLNNIGETIKNLAENIAKIIGEEVKIPKSDEFKIITIEKDGSIKSFTLRASDILDSVLHNKNLKINNENLNLCDVLKGLILGAIKDKGLGIVIEENNKPIKTFNLDEFKK
jgi:transposase-like protein/predicted  nucleic acid-binding Zn-ribbon protein